MMYPQAADVTPGSWLTSLIASALFSKRNVVASEREAARDEEARAEIVGLLEGINTRLDRLERR